MKEFREIKPDATGTRRLRLLQDVMGQNNCWNQPKAVALKAGDVLSCAEVESGHDGALFFKLNTTTTRVRLLHPAYQSRYPGDLGVFNPDFLVEI